MLTYKYRLKFGKFFFMDLEHWEAHFDIYAGFHEKSVQFTKGRGDIPRVILMSYAAQWELWEQWLKVNSTWQNFATHFWVANHFWVPLLGRDPQFGKHFLRLGQYAIIYLKLNLWKESSYKFVDFRLRWMISLRLRLSLLNMLFCVDQILISSRRSICSLESLNQKKDRPTSGNCQLTSTFTMTSHWRDREPEHDGL